MERFRKLASEPAPWLLLAVVAVVAQPDRPHGLILACTAAILGAIKRKTS